MILVELDRNEKGWTLFDPETGLAIGGPFGTEADAVNHADSNGWLIQE